MKIALSIFIVLQCVKVLNYNPDFDITIVSDMGIKKLSEDEVKNDLHKQDQVDHTLKKLFSDFFITGVKKV